MVRARGSVGDGSKLKSQRRLALSMSAAPSDPVLVRRVGNIAVVTINNPPFNVLTTPVVDGLAGAVVELTRDATVRAIVITGSGDKAFSSGANVKEMASLGPEEAARYSSKGQALTNLIERAPVPVIAAVRGYCLGGGCELSLSCDFIVAAEDAQFAQPEINIGVIPGWGGSRRLTRAIGVARARHWIFTGQKFSAAHAYADGLVHSVVPPKKLLEEAIGLAQQLASKGALAMAAAKYAVNQASDATRLLGLEYERDLWQILFSSHDQKEGMGAFLDKRPAQFTDRVDWDRMRRGQPWKNSTDAFDEASREAQLVVRDKGQGVLSTGYSAEGAELLNQMLTLSVESFNTYQKLVEETWRAAMAPFLLPARNRNGTRA